MQMHLIIKSGYVNTDLNGDLFVDLNDLIICDNNSYKTIRAINPPTMTLKKKTLRSQKIINEMK